MTSISPLTKNFQYLLNNIRIRALVESPLYRVCRLDAWLSWLIAFLTGAAAAFTKYQSNPASILSSTLAFCLMTSSIFILNQCFDIENDRGNGYKSKLPMARGEISFRLGLLIGLFFLISSIVLSIPVGRVFQIIMLIYFLLWLAYSHPKIHLKSKPVIDLIVAGIGAGVIPYLAGWSCATSFSQFPISLGVFFLLAQAGGHTIHIAGDMDADVKVGLNTSAVKFGRKAVTRWGLIFLLSSLTLFIASVCNGEMPLMVTAISIPLLPITFFAISKHITTIMGDAQTPNDFEELRQVIMHLEIYLLVAYPLAFIGMLVGHPS